MTYDSIINDEKHRLNLLKILNRRFLWRKKEAQ